ncbi:MAG: peptidoglycan DD-metalloendopeptidase family protein [Magnetovibrionaceae bacterium]
MDWFKKRASVLRDEITMPRGPAMTRIIRLTTVLALAGAALGLGTALGDARENLVGARDHGVSAGLTQLDIAPDKTFGLAPISVGHPQIVAALVTRPPERLGPTLARLTPQEIAHPRQEVVRLRSGDTLSALLKRAGVSSEEAYQAIQALREVFDPRDLRAGQSFTLTFQEDPLLGRNRRAAEKAAESLVALQMKPDLRHEIHVVRLGDGFAAEKQKRALVREVIRAEAEITSSLYVDGDRAGVPPAILVEFIRLYSWDVDFQRSIRKGDRFEVLYERLVDEKGRIVESGNILYAGLTLSGEELSLYRFEGGKAKAAEYFDARGKGARKGLMRTPINGARLSSGYGKRRHPILGYNKMHRGVDFAAPTGTPIFAAGDGVIEVAGRKGGYGNYVRIRHTNGYATAYAHMHRFGKGIRAGKHVKQGRIIGTVGTTGRSTGPHLHYEILVNGKHVNPMRVRMPAGRTLKGKELAKFQAARDAIRSQWAERGLPGKVARNKAGQ